MPWTKKANKPNEYLPFISSLPMAAGHLGAQLLPLPPDLTERSGDGPSDALARIEGDVHK